MFRVNFLKLPWFFSLLSCFEVNFSYLKNFLLMCSTLIFVSLKCRYAVIMLPRRYLFILIFHKLSISAYKIYCNVLEFVWDAEILKYFYLLWLAEKIIEHRCWLYKYCRSKQFGLVLEKMIFYSIVIFLRSSDLNLCQKMLE